jgi:hypothetical protein
VKRNRVKADAKWVDESNAIGKPKNKNNHAPSPKPSNITQTDG